jgi:hypothetical protein
METRTYYVPRSYFARMVLDRIVSLVPCCMSRIENAAGNTISFTITCRPTHYSIVEAVLHQEGWLA